VKLQKHAWTCGPYAILNAARAIGVRLTEAEIRKHTDTTPEDGTNEHGIKNALERLGFESASFTMGQDRAFEQLFQGHPVIISVEDGKHWIAVIGTVGKRVLTFDSWMAKWNSQESGVNSLSKRQLMHWWTPEKNGLYSGIPLVKAED
jgi:ABC-type bacteriocin/lantibiotic exporter with double-glycine peptidase domain